MVFRISRLSVSQNFAKSSKLWIVASFHLFLMMQFFLYVVYLMLLTFDNKKAFRLLTEGSNSEYCSSEDVEQCVTGSQQSVGRIFIDALVCRVETLVFEMQNCCIRWRRRGYVGKIPACYLYIPINKIVDLSLG